MAQRERHTKKAAFAAHAALRAADKVVHSKPGATTQEVADAASAVLEKLGAVALFLGHGGFPAKVCVSVDEEIAHGVPGDRVIHAGDLVKVDVGAKVGDWCADAAWTFVAGGYHRDADRERLYRAGLEAFVAAIAAVTPWAAVSAVGEAVAKVAEERGVAVVKRMTGHHIGKDLHELPLVPNYPIPGFDKLQFRPGFAVAIEPILALGSGDVAKDGWVIKTADGQPSVHFEETLVPGVYRFCPMELLDLMV